jgi:hypothetical protein
MRVGTRDDLTNSTRDLDAERPEPEAQSPTYRRIACFRSSTVSNEMRVSFGK